MGSPVAGIWGPTSARGNHGILKHRWSGRGPNVDKRLTKSCDGFFPPGGLETAFGPQRNFPLGAKGFRKRFWARFWAPSGTNYYRGGCNLSQTPVAPGYFSRFKRKGQGFKTPWDWEKNPFCLFYLGPQKGLLGANP